jgi:glycosyltransferase involved in cell wall biosynthesis
MHILFLSDNFPPEVNAPASRTFEHCREWVKAGHRVTVLTCTPNFPKGEVYPGYRNTLWQSETMDGVRVIRVWSYITANAGFLRRILDYQSFMIMAILVSPFIRRVDVVIGTSPQFFTVCAAYVVSLLKAVPFVFELRDLWPESIKAVGAMRDSLAIRVLEKIELFLYRKAARIVSVTCSFKRSLIAMGVDAEKIHVVTNGLDVSRFKPEQKDAALVKRLGLEGKFVAGYIGTLGMAHSLETILEAADHMRRQPGGDVFAFMFLGDGARKKVLQEKARAMNLDNVVFVESVAKHEVVKYWALLDASIIHLKKSDVFTQVIPSKLFESMGMGIPVLHGVAGESAEIVRRDRVGLVFDPENSKQLAEHLSLVRTDRELYSALRERCLKAAPKYDRTQLANDMLDVLKTTVTQHAPAVEPMRVLFVNRYFHPDCSATSQLLTELAEDLIAQGASVTVISGRTLYQGKEPKLSVRDVHKGIRIVRVGFIRFDRSYTLGRLADYFSFWVSALWAAARMRNLSCLVVLSDPPLLSLLAAIIRLVKPVKAVCWLQDLFPDVAIEAGVIRLRPARQVLNWLTQWSLRNMDQIIVIGRCMERRLLRHGLSADKIVTIPNWADGHHISPLPRQENAFLIQHGLEDKFVVMYSGNHGMVHDFEGFMSLARATQSYPELRFCFIGDGAWRNQLINVAKAENWQHVLFLPYQDRAVLRSSLAAADVHLVSLRTEMEGLSIPSKIYSVLAAGRPVIFFGPANSEPAAILREGQCGFTVKPGDTEAAVKALLTVYKDRSLLEKQGQAARLYFSRRFDRNIATQNFHQVFQRVAMAPPTLALHRSPISPPSKVA